MLRQVLVRSTPVRDTHYNVHRSGAKLIYFVFASQNIIGFWEGCQNKRKHLVVALACIEYSFYPQCLNGFVGTNYIARRRYHLYPLRDSQSRGFLRVNIIPVTTNVTLAVGFTQIILFIMFSFYDDFRPQSSSS